MFLSNPASKYNLCAYTLSSDCVCVGASDLRAGLACEHDKRSECQQLDGDHKPQGPAGPSAAMRGDQGSATAQAECLRPGTGDTHML